MVVFFQLDWLIHNAHNSAFVSLLLRRSLVDFVSYLRFAVVADSSFQARVRPFALVFLKALAFHFDQIVHDIFICLFVQHDFLFDLLTRDVFHELAFSKVT